MNILLVLAVVFAALESLALFRGLKKLEWVAKPAVMLCLFVWLYLRTGLQGLTLWFGIGILFSLAGDVLLMISLEQMFIFGLVAFLLAHIFYLVGFQNELMEVNLPFPKPGQDPYSVRQLADLLARHPGATTIWAHVGLGRVVHPVADQLGMMERALTHPLLGHLYPDISWDETAKYLVATLESTARVAGLINRHPDRFLFGTAEVAPSDQQKYLKVYDMYAPLLARLTPEAREKLLKGNYERLFDAARAKVRAWEKEHVR